MRQCIETEAMYASEYPFVDYGSDLTVMSELEKGVKIQKLKESPADAKLQPD